MTENKKQNNNTTTNERNNTKKHICWEQDSMQGCVFFINIQHLFVWKCVQHSFLLQLKQYPVQLIYCTKLDLIHQIYMDIVAHGLVWRTYLVCVVWNRAIRHLAAHIWVYYWVVKWFSVYSLWLLASTSLSGRRFDHREHLSTRWLSAASCVHKHLAETESALIYFIM